MSNDHLSSPVSDEERKAALKKLNARAIKTKMDLHDLAEELPRDWQQIMTVAQAAYDAHVALAAAKAEG